MRAWPLLLLATVSASASAADQGWRVYGNGRYALRICYPSALFVPQGESENGDGQTFKARDGAELRVFGSNNALDRSLAEEAEAQAAHLLGRSGTINYRAARRNWQVTLGDDGGAGLFYLKTFVRNDQFLSFQLRYPKTRAAQYRPIVEQIARCFAALPSAPR